MTEAFLIERLRAEAALLDSSDETGRVYPPGCIPMPAMKWNTVALLREAAEALEALVMLIQHARR